MDSTTTIIRLAQEAGLTRQEIQSLQWKQLDIIAGCIVLETRMVELSAPLQAYLRDVRAMWEPITEYVVFGRNQGAMALGSISRLAGSAGVSLTQLRREYIQTQLQSRSWQDISRETGLGEEVLRRDFGVTMTQESVLPDVQVVEQALVTLEESLGTLAVCLAYDGGYSVSAMGKLRWEAFAQCAPSGRIAQLVNTLKGAPTDYVFPNATATAPLDAPRLSRLGRDTLVSCGLDGVTLQTLAKVHNLHRGDGAMVAQLLQAHGAFTSQMAQAVFGDNKSATYRRLQVLVKAGVLVQVGRGYYDAKTVPEVDAHETLVLQWAREHGVIYRGDVEELLGIGAYQCGKLLKKLSQLGELVQVGQRYIPNEEKEK